MCKYILEKAHISLKWTSTSYVETDLHIEIETLEFPTFIVIIFIEDLSLIYCVCNMKWGHETKIHIK